MIALSSLPLPALHMHGIDAVQVMHDGTTNQMKPRDALERLSQNPHILCHRNYLIDRLAMAGQCPDHLTRQAREQKHYDIAELFAFVMPAIAVTPTPQAIARQLELDDDAAISNIAQALLDQLASAQYRHIRETMTLAGFLERANWPWAPMVQEVLVAVHGAKKPDGFVTGLNVWDRVAEYDDDGPQAPGSHEPVTAQETQNYLAEVLGNEAEQRQAQMDYSAQAALAFKPRPSRHENTILLAEAGTGLGKTLGYLAPAFLWAKRNKSPVWISTYTKNLQRQLEQETARLVADPVERRRRIVIRKGRENYVCLLNLQEAFGRLTAANSRSALMAALIARWVRYSRDGDMIGGDFPAWLISLFYGTNEDAGPVSPMSLGLTDKRGECVYAACQHYRKCFIERTVRASRQADLVIANHALVLHQAAVDFAIGAAVTAEDEEASNGLKRLVFDEGHHLFDAADNAFSSHLTGLETAELRRWIMGPEVRGRRGRALADRLGDLISNNDIAETALHDIINACQALPGPGWQRRLHAEMPEGTAEKLFAIMRVQIQGRAGSGNRLSQETECRPMIDGLAAAASDLHDRLNNLQRPMAVLAETLLKMLDDKAAELNTSERGRIEALARSLKRRGTLIIAGWSDMLNRLQGEPDPFFVEWFALDRAFGREHDVGMHSHWVDPSEPLARAVLSPADGIIITSATLKDQPPDTPDDWQNAEMRTGVVHLPYPVIRAGHESPFDYQAMSRIVVVNDIGREDMDHLAAAYRELFIASGGGALGLFTAISRLKAVHKRLIAPLARSGFALYAQHIDPMDTGTLVDMFKSDKHGCLLGTDAVRDGVDVPGDALRLMVMDRVPWGQPTILEKARRQAFGGASYQDMIVRLRLRQAFGRLIRRKTDRGVFVVLDNRLASRFGTAFPPGMEIERMGLVEALDLVADFIQPLAGQTDSN